jgi:D-alanine-D-alanine ligase
VGVSIVNDEKEFQKAVDMAFALEDSILVEEYISGGEFTCAVLDGKALPVVQIEPLEGFYDYKNKYNGNTKETCPANISAELTEKMQYWAQRACEAAGVTTYARVDELMNEDGEIYCLEINTLPGMTPTSLLPQEAAAAGMSYDELTEKIIQISLAKY